MAAPQGAYPPQEGYAQPGYGSSAPEEQQSPVQGQAAHGQAAARKKRAYAGQAYDFGAGANAALGGQPTAGGDYGQYPPQPPVEGYQQQPMYGGDPSQMQPAAAGYAPPAPPGMQQMTQQFGAMGMGDPHQMAPQQQHPVPQAARPVQLNQLYPTDLLSQPFNVAELDYPPPPITLPPGVCALTVTPPKWDTDLVTDERLSFP